MSFDARKARCIHSNQTMTFKVFSATDMRDLLITTLLH